MKKFLTVFIGLVIIIIILIVGGKIYYNLHRVSYNNKFKSNVNSEIVIKRSIDGIPEIVAESHDDLYFSLGFIHAQDRLKLMEYYRAIVYGYISKLIGNEAKKLEWIIKITGITVEAESIYKKLTDPYKKYIQSYVDGINVYKKQNKIKSKIKNNWDITDIISILLLREWSNSFLNNKENIFQFPVNNSKFYTRQVFPADLTFFYDNKNFDKIKLVRDIKKILQKYVGTFNRGFSFNISAKKSSSGKPVTGNSFENTISVYPSIYPVLIKLGKNEINGITYTGLPFIFAGKTGSMNFTGLNLNVDIQDFVMEEVKNLKGELFYLSRAGWENISYLRVPTYGNGQKANEITWTTVNGPLLIGYHDKDKEHNYFVSIKYFFPGVDYITSLFDVPFSENIEKAKIAVKNINSYPRVYLFSNNEYSIKTFSGKFPNRVFSRNVFKKGINVQWTGFIDLSVYNYVKFDNTIAGSFLYDNKPAVLNNYIIGTRNKTVRLNKLLNKNIIISEKDAMNILLDKYSSDAKRFTPIFLSVLKTNLVTSARLTRIYFNQWNFNMDPGNVAPSIFYFCLKNFIHETLKDEIKNDFDYVMENYYYLLNNFYEIVKTGNSDLFNDKDTDEIENMEMIFDRAFFKSIRLLNRRNSPYMDKWKWGRILQWKYNIPIKSRSLLSNLFRKSKMTKFSGSSSTLYSGVINNDFYPVSCTSTSIFYGKISSKINMNYTYSINALSDFYYGDYVDKGFINFDKITKKFITTIIPDNL